MPIVFPPPIRCTIITPQPSFTTRSVLSHNPQTFGLWVWKNWAHTPFGDLDIIKDPMIYPPRQTREKIIPYFNFLIISEPFLFGNWTTTSYCTSRCGEQRYKLQIRSCTPVSPNLPPGLSCNNLHEAATLMPSKVACLPTVDCSRGKIVTNRTVWLSTRKLDWLVLMESVLRQLQLGKPKWQKN